MYIAEQAHRVRKVAPSGVITTVAGTGVTGYSGDGGPAAQAQLAGPFGVAIGLDGTLYVADTVNNRVRRVGTDGVITTVAGDGTAGFAGDGGPARQAKLRKPRGLVVERDGGLVVVDTENHRVRRIDANGIIRTIAGTGIQGAAGDGGPATAALLNNPTAVAAAPDGSLYIADGAGYRIRRIGSDGVITKVTGATDLTAIREGVPALTAEVGSIAQMQVGPDGALYLVEMHSASNRVRRIAPPPMAGVSIGEMVLPSENGREAYVFSGVGKHLRTIDTRTGATLYQMHYDAAGRLAAVVNVDGDTTTIGRDATGNPVTITGPFGQTTQLAVNADGYLEMVTNPAAEVVVLSYGTDGLLTGLNDALGRAHVFTYDAMGLLVKDEDPAGGSKTLTREKEPGGYSVTVTTALGRSTTHHVVTLPTGTPQRTVELPSGLAGSAIGGAGSAVTTTRPDGRVLSWTPAPDPRFGMLVPLVTSQVLTTPGGRALAITRSRVATLLDPNDAMSFTSITDTTTVNGKSFIEVFAKAPRTLTRTTPEGRQVTTTLDSKGRVVQISVLGVLPVQLAYDAHGRLETATQGTRTLTRVYGPDGFLQSVVDPLAHTWSFTPDAVGRVLAETRPDGEEVLFTYDDAGNGLSVTPPSQPSHLFTYTPVDLQASYSPPDLPAGPTPTSWSYDVDRKLTLVTKAGGAAVSYGYDAAGRQTSVTFPDGTITRTYDAATGKLATVTGPAGVTLSYGYDGHLLTDMTWSGAISGTLHRTYNNDLRVTTETVNGGSAVSFAYDDDGLLTGAGGLSLTRDAQNGRVTGTSLGAVVESLIYDAFGAVEQRALTAGGMPLFSVTYVRDAVGRLVERTETFLVETHSDGFVYDLAGRLTDVYRDGALTAHYEVDENGNRLSRTTAGGSVVGAYDDQDRLLSYGGVTYAYQDSGELLSRMDTATGATTLYGYDAIGNLHLQG